jgi:hypothetical protein
LLITLPHYAFWADKKSSFYIFVVRLH